MKRNLPLLLNKIISLGLIVPLYLAMSISAFADITDAPSEDTHTPTEEVASVPESSPAPEASAPAEPSTLTNEAPASEVTPPAAGETPSEGTTPSEGITSTDGTTPTDGNQGESDIAGDQTPKDDLLGDDLNQDGDGLEGDGLDGELDDELEDELDGDKLEDEELEEEDAEEECEHELVYTSNEDGSHTVTCALCDMEEYSETCEYDDDGICVKCGYKRLPDPVLVYEDEYVIVTVSGAVPENADLKVKPITEADDETRDLYNHTAGKMEELLADSENEVYGFLAYDICFTNIETGEEVEPSDNVTISMEYKSEILPVSKEDVNNAKALKVDVVHINEKTDEVENLTEAGSATVSTSSDTSVKSASFTSDSFSVYTLLWNGYTNRQIEVTFNNVFVEMLDGEEVPEYEEIQESINMDGSTPEIMISDKVDDIPGYKFRRADYKVDGIGKDVDGLKLIKKDNSNSYYLQLLNEGAEVAKVALSSSAKATVNIYYEKNINLTVQKIATGAAKEDTTTTYEFVIKNSEDVPVGATKYYVGEELRTTDAASGMFTLLSGQKAEFIDLPAGSYYITETGTSRESTYTLGDFTTKILEVKKNQADTLLVQYEAASQDSRVVETSVDDESTKNIKFKNCYTTVTGPTEIVSATVAKYIRYHAEDDNYDLTIKFKGPEQKIVTTIDTSEELEQQEKIKVDIVLVVDKSNSMGYATTHPTYNTRMKCVVAAVDSMVETMKDKDDVDAKWKVIDFGQSAKLMTSNWIDTGDVVVTENLGPAESIGGGTNYCAGLKMANDQMSGARSDAKTIVIFLTDGCPTYGIKDGRQIGKGTSLTTEIETATYNYAGQLECDYFYAIGMGLGYNSYSDTSGGIDAFTLLQNMSAKVKAKEGAEAYNISPEKVGSIFDSLAGTISSIAAGGLETSTEMFYSSNVVMTDTLSEYVDIVPDSTFKINVTLDLQDVQDESVASVPGVIKNGIQESPATYTLPDGTVLTANYIVKNNADGTVVRTISMVFPQGYLLDDGYEYQVKFYVQPSDLAYDYYYEHKDDENPYPHTGDDETDHGNNRPITSSLLPGFYSNGVANTTYVINNQSGKLDFPKPVVQVHFTNVWEIYKVNQSGDYLDGAEFLLEEQAEEGTVATSYTGTSQQVEQLSGLVVWNDTVATGKIYKLKEMQAPTGYVTSNDNWIITISDENVPTVRIVTESGNPEGTEYLVEPVRDGKVITYRFEFINKKASALPYTGGSGVYKTTVTGIAMMILSAFMFYLNRRKKAGF